MCVPCMDMMQQKRLRRTRKMSIYRHVLPVGRPTHIVWPPFRALDAAANAFECRTHLQMRSSARKFCVDRALVFCQPVGEERMKRGGEERTGLV